MTKPDAPATERNKNAILEVLRNEFQDRKEILEIGSGTGQHAVFFARQMPWLTWQTSDRPNCHEGIHAWLDDAGLDNVFAPLELDVEKPFQNDNTCDAVFSANTAHIMSVVAVECMFELAGACLSSGGKFCLYGPFNQDGDFTSDSNRDFDANLKSQDPAMGIRDLESLDDFARANGLQRTNLYAMPANNMIAVWSKK
jgi:cyclopropane fatty-acyl-phospholipid synthase-like methyltransferase